MPLCQVSTNLPRAKVDESFAKELSKYVAGVLDSSEKVATLHVMTDQIMVRHGSLDPMVHLAMHGHTPQCFTEAMKVKWMESLTPFLSEKLGISDLSRIVISFHPMDASQVGINGKLASQMQ